MGSDFCELKRINSKLSPKNTYDLESEIPRITGLGGSLSSLCCLLYGYSLNKKYQKSCWNGWRLSMDKQIYAATDAWICYRIYLDVLNGKINKENEFPIPIQYLKYK